jgi:hypothetical protein
MAEEGNQSSGFKVVDRRPFAVDGSRRTDIAAEETKAEKSRATPEPAPNALDDRVDERFVMLVEFLGQTALAHMGAAGGPSGEALPIDLESARASIDLIGVLQDKTKGNLSSSERKFLSNVLFELHTRFVEIQKRITAKHKR